LEKGDKGGLTQKPETCNNKNMKRPLKTLIIIALKMTTHLQLVTFKACRRHSEQKNRKHR
jgi:hypothetical protein